MRQARRSLGQGYAGHPAEVDGEILAESLKHQRQSSRYILRAARQKGNRMREQKQKSTVPIRVDRELYARVQRMAEDEHRSVRFQFELLVERGMGKPGKETR